MSYYASGDYGDYYEGDIFGFVKKAVGGLGRIAAGTGIPVVSQIGGIVGGLGGSGGPRVPTILPPPPGRGGSMTGINIGGQRGITIGKRIGPGEVVGFPQMPDIQMPRKRRRMNYNNPRALARANRRRDGFIRNAKKSIKGSGYKIVPATRTKIVKEPCNRCK